MTKLALLVTQVKNGYLVSTPNQHRWNEQGTDVMVFETPGKLLRYLTDRIVPIDALLVNDKAVRVAADAISFDTLVRLMHSLPEKYRADATWIMHPATTDHLLALRDGTGEPIFSQARSWLFGQAVMLSPTMPQPHAGSIVIAYGDFDAALDNGSVNTDTYRLLELTA